MIAPVVAALVVAFAGHPVTVACDADVNPSPFPTAPGAIVTAWTMTGGSVIHALPSICDETNDPVGTIGFADGIATMLHEAGRAHGWQSDSCVELFADLAIYQALRDYYAIPMFSRESFTIGRQVLNLTRGRPASYAPEACWRSGVMR